MRDLNMGSIRSIDRAIDILETFSIEKLTLSIEEIAKITKIPNSTVYRILCTLEKRAYVQYDEKLQVYKPGLKLMSFGLLLPSVLDIRQEAEDILYKLHKDTEQSVLMAVPEGDEILYIYSKENWDGLKYSSSVGQRRPYIYGVLGPVILAFSSKEHISHILSLPLAKHTKDTVLEKDIIFARLLQIKEQQYYIGGNETTVGVTGIGAPIFSINGEILAAIGVIGPSIQVDDQIEDIKPNLMEAAKQISLKMGYKL